MSLSDAELDAVRALGEPPVVYARHAVIRREGEGMRYIYLLIEGWVASSMLLPGGDRQIIKLQLPGDMLGTSSMCLTITADTLSALTSVTVSRVPLAAFGALFAASPRFAAGVFLSAQRERVALMDRLAAVGRTPAIARVAALLLDVGERLGAAGLSRTDDFELPVTQEQVGDHVGLTAVHVNRIFRQLGDAGMIRRQRQRIELLDVVRLKSVSGRQERHPTHDGSWLMSAGTRMA